MSAEERKATLDGLRDLADWLEAHPEVPTPAYEKFTLFPQNSAAGRLTLGEAVTEMRRIAALMGVEPRQQGPHAAATVRFGRHLTFEVVVCGVDLEHFPANGGGHVCATCGETHETSRAGDSETAPEVAAIATTQPGSTALLGAEEVAGPVEGTGSATAPADEPDEDGQDGDGPVDGCECEDCDDMRDDAESEG